VGSLILIPLEDFPVAFFTFFRGVRLAVAFHLPAQVLEALALALTDGSLVDSPPGHRAKIGIAGICHTPFRERGNEVSIRVPRMFKSHAW
jgi:hypothetical protein